VLLAWACPNDNALALLLFMLAVPVFTFFVSPLMASSRRDEFQADAYAMAQADGAALARHCSSCTRTMPPRSRPTRCT
jgi:Zn-dependent protease with chaperone function